MTLTADHTARFRTACSARVPSLGLRPPLRSHWMALVAVVTDAANGRADSNPELAHHLRDLGARPADFLALHQAFDGVLADMDLGAASLSALEAAVDATLTGLLVEAYGFRAHKQPMAA